MGSTLFISPNPHDLEALIPACGPYRLLRGHPMSLLVRPGDSSLGGSSVISGSGDLRFETSTNQHQNGELVLNPMILNVPAQI